MRFLELLNYTVTSVLWFSLGVYAQRQLDRVVKPDASR